VTGLGRHKSKLQNDVGRCADQVLINQVLINQVLINQVLINQKLAS
jgi:hypothetical protein